ncbi:MAG: hypothetical protein KC643_33360 [Nitrospira sp.]|nr:hypothetical protein [Nitrospira sp.]
MADLTTATIRPSSLEPIDLWFQLDEDKDGHPDAAMSFPGYLDMEVRMKPKAGNGPTLSFKATDIPRKLTVVDPFGTTQAPNGVLASKAQLKLSGGELSASATGYDLRIIITDALGRTIPIPENHNLELWLFEEF